MHAKKGEPAEKMEWYGLWIKSTDLYLSDISPLPRKSAFISLSRTTIVSKHVKIEAEFWDFTNFEIKNQTNCCNG